MNVHVEHPMMRKVRRALRAGGDLYTFEDIMFAIEDGKFQSFAHNDSWVVTQILEFPRRKLLETIIIIGRWRDLEFLEKQIIAFAKEQQADALIGSGRGGWLKRRLPGWKTLSHTFIKEI